jgi:hypothetical protein
MPGAGVVYLRRDGRALIVELQGTPARIRPPLVMLVSVGDPTEHFEQESVAGSGGVYLARFDEVGSGAYLVVIEPMAR